MKVVLHAGLHKSGTTSVQGAWRAAFGELDTIWYPRPWAPLPGHHAQVWHLLDAYTETQAADLEWSHTLTTRTQPPLSSFFERAREGGVETLLLSSEELDRMQPSDAPRFAELLDGHEVTLLLTVTRPLHRWSSGWQTLVKHGLAHYPGDAAAYILSYGCLEPNRLEELVGMLDVDRRIVRVVRTSPPERALPRELLAAAGVDWPEGTVAPEVRNPSLGTDVEVLRRMNELDLGLGTKEPRARRRMEALVASATDQRSPAGLADRYRPPPELWVAAAAERDYLSTRAEAAGVQVLDPHGELESWTEDQPSSWYRTIAERELVVPGLDEPTMSTDERLWRVRQQRSAYRVRLEEARKELADLQKVSDRQAGELDALREQLARYQRLLVVRAGRRVKRALRL